MVDALRAGGDLTGERAVLLADLARFLNIAPLRQKTEIRRAVNNELLATLAARLGHLRIIHCKIEFGSDSDRNFT